VFGVEKDIPDFKAFCVSRKLVFNDRFPVL